MAIKFLNKGLSKRFRDMAKKLPQVKNETLMAVAEEAKADFEKTVETWNTKPEFTIEERPRSLAVVTDDEIYHFVDGGTKPHKIPVGEAGFLAFRGGYQAKTSPRVIQSRQGGASGGYVYTTKTIDHPGTEAREFTKTIHDKWERELPGRMRQALNEGIEAVGL